MGRFLRDRKRKTGRQFARLFLSVRDDIPAGTGTHAGRSSRMRAVVDRGSNSRFFLLPAAGAS